MGKVRVPKHRVLHFCFTNQSTRSFMHLICCVMHVKWWHLSKYVCPWSAFSCWTYIRQAIHSIRHTCPPKSTKPAAFMRNGSMCIFVHKWFKRCALLHLSRCLIFEGNCYCTVQETCVFLCVPGNVLSEQWRIRRVELHIEWKLPVVTWIKNKERYFN